MACSIIRWRGEGGRVYVRVPTHPSPTGFGRSGRILHAIGAKYAGDVAAYSVTRLQLRTFLRAYLRGWDAADTTRHVFGPKGESLPLSRLRSLGRPPDSTLPHPLDGSTALMRASLGARVGSHGQACACALCVSWRYATALRGDPGTSGWLAVPDDADLPQWGPVP